MRKSYPKPKFAPKTSHPSIQDIKGLRASCGLTQAQLAELLEVSIHSVEKWETGSKMPLPVWRLFNILSEGLCSSS